MNAKICTLSALILAVSAGPLFSETQTSQSRSFAVSAGGELELKTSVGDVNIDLRDGPELSVSARGADERDLQIEQNGNYVKLNYSGRGRHVQFDLQVPSRFNLNLSTGGGDVRISGNLTGRLEVATQGGDVDFGDVQGEAVVKSSGGDIQGGTIAGNSEIKTLGGDIELGSVRGDLTVNTQGGDIEVEDVGSSLTAKTLGGDVQVGNVAGRAELSTLGGDLEVGRVDGPAQLKTLGGDVALRSAAGDVTASTAGGDLALSEISGTVEAKTAGGDISAELVSIAGPSSLTSKGGDIALTVPGGAGATVEARIRVRRSWEDREDYEFISDFPADSTGENPDSRELWATYKINGGGPVISVETVNGSIMIRRGGS